ncbi:malonyl-CoA decarboxylase [Acidiphilium sp. MT5]
MTLSSPPDRPHLAPAGRGPGTRAWLAGVFAAIAERTRRSAVPGSAGPDPLDYAKLLAASLISERGEASGAAIAQELLAVLASLSAEQLGAFCTYLGDGFVPDPAALRAASSRYLEAPNAENSFLLAEAAEPPRQELLRRMNMAPGGTAALIALRRDVLARRSANPAQKRLDADLRHLFSSWFNRGFLELRRIDWQTPAAILEKLIAYEAVHEIQDWQDLRRRLAADRRCFGFFHPALPGEPLIFVEVALVHGLAGSVTALLDRDADDAAQRARAAASDTAIFYSISNCQDGLRGISFGNLLIKQVVEELRNELPNLRYFSTLSPVPGFRAWLEGSHGAAVLAEILPDDTQQATQAATRAALAGAQNAEQLEATALRPILLQLCARYLTGKAAYWRIDPVAKFHLGNGARLERINWMANPTPRGYQESYGIMVNYLYDLAAIEENHEDFTRDGHVHRGASVEALLKPPVSAGEKPGLVRRMRLG